MLDLQVVEVRALTDKDGPRQGTYIRGGRLWHPGWQESIVDVELLALLSSDPRLQVRVLDLRVQAARKAEFATQAEALADADEAKAKESRRHANDLRAEADLALESVKGQAPPQAAPAPTPFADSFVAAMPDAVRPEALKPKGKK